MRPIALALVIAASLAPAAAAALDRASCGCELSRPDPQNREAEHGGGSMGPGERLVTAMEDGHARATSAAGRGSDLVGRRLLPDASAGEMR
jgi:hypothetical protein